MSPSEAKFLACRGAAVMQEARSQPQCAKSARNWLVLAAKYAERCGLVDLANDMRHFEQSILGI